MIERGVVYVFRDGRLVPKHLVPREVGPKSDLPCPLIQRDLPAYYSVASQRWVDGRSDRREDLARTGCRPLDPSEKNWKLNERRRRGDDAFHVPGLD